MRSTGSMWSMGMLSMAMWSMGKRSMFVRSMAMRSMTKRSMGTWAKATWSSHTSTSASVSISIKLVSMSFRTPAPGSEKLERSRPGPAAAASTSHWSNMAGSIRLCTFLIAFFASWPSARTVSWSCFVFTATRSKFARSECYSAFVIAVVSRRFSAATRSPIWARSLARSEATWRSTSVMARSMLIILV